jgi:hypothetical protein
MLGQLILSISRIPNTLSQTLAGVQGTIVDKAGLSVSGAEVRLSDSSLTEKGQASTDETGAFRILGIPPGTYTLAVSKLGFDPQRVAGIQVIENRVTTINFILRVQTRKESVQATSQAPLLEANSSATGASVTSHQIHEMPLNGSNYLDLMQLVPGVVINRQNDRASDNSAPILGERGGNAAFLIDGLPNRDEVNGGPEAQFDRYSILEFQVITGSYKAEFGHGSGGIINIVSKSGTNDWHGGAALFYRNDAMDSSDIPNTSAPFLHLGDASAQLGGPILRDKIFFFASAERILESRQLNFQFPPNTPDSLIVRESALDQHSETHDTRARLKFDENWGHHRLDEQMILTNNHLTNYLPLSQGFSLPSTRNDMDSSTFMLGFSDSATLGDQNDPLLMNAYGQFRKEPNLLHPAYPGLGPPRTLADLFSSLTTGTLFGDLGSVELDPGYTPLNLNQEYASFGVGFTKALGRQTWKAGWDFERTIVNGAEANSLFNQLLATTSDLSQFGPINAGLHFLTVQGNSDPNGLKIRLRNNYDGLYVQDDFKMTSSLTLNLGVRWDYDSTFPNKTNFSPRLGFAWSITPKTVLRGSFGLFYDHFRLGTARDIPAFGGATLIAVQYLSLPRLLYGNPTKSLNNRAARGLGTPCVSNDLTDAQIAAMGLKCPIKLPDGTIPPYHGVDYLNYVVAPGHAPIPADAVVNIDNVEQLTGLTPKQFADEASEAIGDAPGFFLFDPLGSLATTEASDLPIAARQPITVDPNFRTPYTRSYFLGIQRQLSQNVALDVEYYHKDIRNILGLRNTNVAFQARLPGHLLELVPGTGDQIIQSYGPWFHGTYDAVNAGLTKRMSKHFTFSGNYIWTHAIDNDLNSSLTSDSQSAGVANPILLSGPTDSFVGIVPLVTNPTTGTTNANGSFLTGSGDPNNLGNFVPKAGIFYNGAILDKGPSDLAFNHTALVQGTLQLPLGFAVSGIFRAQSGFHYSAFFSGAGSDTDGDNHFNGIDWTKGRNHFVASPFINTDLRLAKEFSFHECSLYLYFEMFNLFNRANPAAVQQLPGQATPFGTVIQVLPGRESQIGLRFDF